jgi:hypothetical protein
MAVASLCGCWYNILPDHPFSPAGAAMKHRKSILITVLVVAGVGFGQPPAPKAASDAPQVFTGKVVLLPASKGKPGAPPEARGVALVADDGTTYALVEPQGAEMLAQDARLRDRPVRLTARRLPGTKSLQVVLVQTVKGGAVHDVDYWCETCRISLSHPGPCYCCGEEAPLRERPAE